MDRLERLVVHVEEAFAMRAYEDLAHLRLGLLLFDSAAELLMHRACLGPLAWEGRKREQSRWLERQADHQELSELSETRRQELRAEVISNRRHSRIEREFDSKADFLAERGEIDPQTARVLKKLHQYRNETYHRDQLRTEVLSSAVSIYAALTCELMRRLTPGWMTSLRLPTNLDKYKSFMEHGPDFDSQGQIADHLEKVHGLDKPLAVGEALSEHVVARLDEMLENIDFCLELLPAGWDRALALAYIQLDEPGKFRAAIGEPPKFRDSEHSLDSIAGWRRQAEELSSIGSKLGAFAAFADLEDEFEPLERMVQQEANEVDHEIQHRIDVARGK